MQHIGRRLKLAYRMPPVGDQPGQLGDASGISAGRFAHEDLAGGHKNIPAFNEPRAFDVAHIRIDLSQGLGHQRGLSQARRRARAHGNRALRQAKGGILDEHRIREPLGCRQFDHFRAGAP